jgi:hypothetical protein
MKKSLLLFLLVVFAWGVADAQNEQDYWIFGHRGTASVDVPFTLDFSSSLSPPECGTFSNSTNGLPPADITGPDDVDMGWEGTGVAIDPVTGELLFYTDGNKVYDGDHADVTPNTSLGGNNSSGQPVALCVKPTCPFDEFYIFSNPTSSDVVTGPVTYRIYNKVAENFSIQTDLPLLASDAGIAPAVSEGLLVIPSLTDPFQFWLMTHIFGTDTYRVYSINSAGIDFPIEYNFGPVFPGVGLPNGVGNFAFTPVSLRNSVYGEFAVANAAAVTTTSQPGAVFTTLFNSSTGVFVPSSSLTVSDNNLSLEYDVEYSPDGTKLYYTTTQWSGAGGNLYQYDFASTLTNTVSPLNNRNKLNGIKNGPDGNLYFLYWNGTGAFTPFWSTVGQITSPNLMATDPLFNASLNMNYCTMLNITALNFPEFITMPLWEANIEITGAVEICPGEETTLVADINSLGEPIQGYEWHHDGALISTTPPPLVVDQPGTYQLYVLLADSCAIISQEVVVGQKQDCCYITANNASIVYSVNTTISTDLAWDNKIYIADNVIVTVNSGATLDITTVDVVFGECAGIDFEDGAILRANNSVFRPCEYNGTWRGLRFNAQGSPTGMFASGIINECTFKNAVNAVEASPTLTAPFDLRLTNNLFSNCNVGVHIQQDVTFVRAITGNTFLIDAEQPEFEGLNCSNPVGIATASWGIRALGVTFTDVIAQNDFVYPESRSVEFTGIELIRITNARITDNHFDNVWRSIAISKASRTAIESNEINMADGLDAHEHQISVQGSERTLIKGNVIRNTREDYNDIAALTSSAIYSFEGSRLTVEQNEITGFETAVQVESTRRVAVTENEITNSFNFGVYLNSTRNALVSCNTIDMDFQSGTNTVGLYVEWNIGAQPSVTIKSNCILETNTAIQLFTTGNNKQLPLINNNYLYNYSFAGIENNGFVGNIGTSPMPGAGAGANTFVTNHGSGLTGDIISSNPLISYGNFGISFISGTVSLAGNNVNSTASCGGQINLSNSSISAMESCDDSNDQLFNIVANGALTESYTVYAQGLNLGDAINVVTELDAQHVNEFSAYVHNTLQWDANDLEWFDVHVANSTKNWMLAAQLLDQMSASDIDEQEHIAIERTWVDAMQNSVAGLSSDQLTALQTIYYRSGRYAHLAQAILVAVGTEVDYDFYPTNTRAHISASLVEVSEDEMLIYPNPASQSITVTYSLNQTAGARIDLFDIAGKLLYSTPVTHQYTSAEIDISHLKAGIYIISLSNADGFQQQSRLVKQ